MSESSLTEFPHVPLSGKITVAEYGAQLISLPSDPEDPLDGDKFCDELAAYKKITASTASTVFKQTLRPMRGPSTRPAIVLDYKEQGIIKGMWDAVRDSGFFGLEEYLRDVEKNPVVNVLYGCLVALSSISNTMYKLKRDAWVAAFPHLRLDIDTVLSDASRVRNWSKGWIRAFEWHPKSPIFAVALHDDSVRVVSVTSDNIPLLRCDAQKNVCCLAFRPYCHSELVIGVEKGIVWWQLDLNAVKPAASRSRLLAIENHAPVTSVQYSSNGHLLLSSSSFDTSIYIWNASTYNKYTPLHRFQGGGVPLALWSPASDKILATSPAKLFRIWERETQWDAKVWNTPKSCVEAACWTPDSHTLIFASGGILYALHFVVNAVEKFINGDNSIVTPLFDVSECHVPSEDDNLQFKVGGRVRSMVLDPTGQRLAVAFDDSELITVFTIQPKSLYYLRPVGFIRGFPDEYPLTIAFQQKFTDGALLMIAWNSGRIQYFPFLFAGANIKKNILHHDYHRAPSSVTPKARKSTLRYRKSVVSEDPAVPSTSTAPQPTTREDTEDGILTSPDTSFRATAFIDPPIPAEYDFLSMNNEPPRLFSLGPRSSAL